MSKKAEKCCKKYKEGKRCKHCPHRKGAQHGHAVCAGAR